jgi:hypothetical protein
MQTPSLAQSVCDHGACSRLRCPCARVHFLIVFPCGSLSFMPTDAATLRFEQALGQFKPSVSLIDAPNEWLAANINQINAIIRLLPGLEKSVLAWSTKTCVLYPVRYNSALSLVPRSISFAAVSCIYVCTYDGRKSRASCLSSVEFRLAMIA